MPLPRFLTAEDFRAKAAKGDKPDVPVRFAFGGCEVKEAEGESRTLVIRISTGSRDRDRDTIDPAGWRLLNYRKNPVVLYGHDYRSLPIGQDTGITQDELGLLARPKFAERDLSPFADTVYRMLLAGYLRAASVGMNPLVWEWNEQERGVDYKQQELLEYSIVPVPANPEALEGAKGLGIDLLPLKHYAEEMLESWHGEQGIWLPRKSLERAVKLAGTNAVLITVPGDLAPEKAARLKTVLGDRLELNADDLLTAIDGLKSEEPATPPAPPAETPVVEIVEPVVPPVSDDIVVELSEEAPPADALELPEGMTEESLLAAIGDATERAVSTSLMALTGRLD